MMQSQDHRQGPGLAIWPNRMRQAHSEDGGFVRGGQPSGLPYGGHDDDDVPWGWSHRRPISQVVTHDRIVRSDGRARSGRVAGPQRRRRDRAGEGVQNEGLDRHDALHAIAWVLVDHMHGLLTRDDLPEDPNILYYRQLEQSTAERWRRSAD